ncbi:MAG: MMPL family transporter, partial [Elusimicrobia bacterium]|nr:MMPL family transporter [Elusimicrobiota bacterium]
VLQDGIGAVRFTWLMEEPPTTRDEALAIRAEAEDHPMFKGSVVSEDGQMLALYIPLEKKSLSYEVAQAVRKILKEEEGPEEYHITGLPVAEDQFGVEMFKQMAISAPLAGLVIFLLLWAFFRSFTLITAPMIMAVVTVIITMGLLMGLKFPVHIMSSMIPIFLMPIAVLDSVHILSEFSEKYHAFGDRKKALVHVMEELFLPMLFTSLTSIAGFFSLSFSPIPPVQVFGIFVAFGIAVAWVLTILFIPAYVMLMSEKSFEKFHPVAESGTGWMDRVLQACRRLIMGRARMVLAATILLIGISVYGISRIQVNDNPVRWFTASHPIRVADKVLNEHFTGTYEAYLVLEAEEKGQEAFKDPDLLRYVERAQKALIDSGLVGKTMTVTDLLKKVYDELLGGDKSAYRIPDTREAVAQTLLSFENSHKPDDLWHVVTPDYDKLNIWLQLKSGDNKDMGKVVRFVKEYLDRNPPPQPFVSGWAGKTYINVVWQDNMVNGMIKNFLGSFVIVFFMMFFLLRSPLKALISMVPLSVTILFIYALLGLFGKDYDMPVAVLSALTLGLSVDFAIHFLQRAVELSEDGRRSWD